MFSRIAIRNVRRQLGNYLIFFLTVAFTVALLFSVSQVIFSAQLTDYARRTQDIASGLTGMVIFISLIVVFVLSYATSFMLKLRKREFGTYLTLGMTKKDILRIFIAENVIICLTALGAGLVLGLFGFQGLMALVMRLLGTEAEIAQYSLKGTLFTVALVAGIFLLATVTSSIYLKRVSIYDLIHGDKRVEKRVRYPFVWGIVTLFSLGVVIDSCISFYQEVEHALLGQGGIGGLIKVLLIFGGGLILFHIGLARSAVYILLRQRRLCSRGTVTFVLRQLSGTLGSNSVMIGMLAFLLTFAVIGANMSFVKRASQESELDQNCPYDIMYCDNQNGSIPVSSDVVEDVIEEYVQIESAHSYTLYTTGQNDFYKHMDWHEYGGGVEGLWDCFISVRDFNALLTPLGYEPVELDDEYMVVLNTMADETARSSWEDMVFVWDGKEYHDKECPGTYPMFCYMYFYVVLPDEAVRSMDVETRYMAYQLEAGRYDVDGLVNKLSHVMSEKYHVGDIYETVDFRFKELMRRSENSTSTMLVVSALVCALVFLFMAMAILALKTLSGILEDRRRYGILSRLGAGEREQRKTLFFQTFSFFVMPFGAAVFINVPVMVICRRIMELGGLERMASQIPVIAGLIALVMTLIYTLYYTATYLIARRTVVCAAKS